MTTQDLEYRGETKPRNIWVATFLTFLAPGMGYVYIGQLLRGLTTNLLFILMLEGFVIAFSVLKFFPVLPALVFLLAWLTFSALVALDVRRRLNAPAPKSAHQADGEESSQPDQEYVLRAYNHWMVYTVVFLLTFAAPLYATGHLVGTYLIEFQSVDDAAVYPTLRPGDIALVDRSAFRGRAPRRGELVSFANDRGRHQILRAVAVEDDIVRIEGETVFVNDEPLERATLDSAPEDEGDLLAMVEMNHGNKYVISVSPRAYTALTLPPTKLAAGEFFVLADNRSQIPLAQNGRQIRDSRNFGTVRRDSLVGKPLYIAWSSSDDDVRESRIGLKTR